MKEYENISEELKEHPCLYDKADKDYKQEDVGRKAWKTIGEKLEIEGKPSKVI